jgi:hypothetical protein
MEFRCEDLRQSGLILIPPADPEYDKLLADIQHRLEQPTAGGPPALPVEFQGRIVPEDRDTSAILLNRSDQPVFAVTLIWNYMPINGRSYRSTITLGAGGFPSLLLPFGMSDGMRKLSGYWHVVLPGSKRYLGGGKMIGDNSDVRPPKPEEMWKGGIVYGGGGGDRRHAVEFQEVTLALDGVFFTDGQFAGPNKGMLWDRVVSEADAAMQVALVARAGHFEGLAPSRIFEKIEEVTGAAPDRGMALLPGWGADTAAWRGYALGKLAAQIGTMRQHRGDEGTIYALSDWAATELPRFRKGLE